MRDNFFDLGGNSLTAIKLFAQIEKIFQTNMPISAIFQAPSIEELAKILRQEKKISSLYSLVPIQPKGSRPVLFVIHWLAYIRNLSCHLGEDQPIYGLHLGIGEVMRNRNELSLTKIEDLAKHYIQEMRMLQPEGPYLLMGYSFGALVAYEIAQQLVAERQQVAFLGIVDTYLHWGEKLSTWQRAVNLFSLSPVKLAKIILQKIQEKIDETLGNNKYLSELDLSSLAKAYRPKPYSGKVHLFKALNPFLISYQPELPEVSWKKLVTANLEIHEIPGNHHSILQESHLKLLAEKLASHLAKSSSD